MNISLCFYSCLPPRHLYTDLLDENTALSELDVLTCLRVDTEETLGVPAGDPVGELFAGLGVRVERFDLDDGDIFGRVLHDGRVIHGFGGLRGIVVDVLDFDVHLNEGREWNHAAVSGVDC